MKQLKYFLFGSAFTLLFVSVIDKFVELIMLWVEVLKISPSKKLLNYQKDVQLIKEFLKPVQHVCDDYDDFEEDDE